MMSNTVFDEDDFIKDIPKNILERTKENMEVYHLEGTELWKAWYYDDFRAYVPCIYEQKYLDLKKYPLKYEGK